LENKTVNATSFRYVILISNGLLVFNVHVVKILVKFKAYSGYICHETFSFMMSLPAMSLGPEGCKQHGHIWARL